MSSPSSPESALAPAGRETKVARKSSRLLRTIAAYEHCVIVAHDNPDPDAIAAGWGLQRLFQERLNRDVRILAGGAIVRAENRHMVELLMPPIELVDDLEIPQGTASILVDCGVGATNHLLTRERIQPVAVIDHHPYCRNGSGGNLQFKDIRTHVAASASIVASYLREQGVDPGVKLATAMLYAMRAETRGCEFRYSRLDRAALTWLTARAEPSLLAAIESAPLDREYFGDLALALQNTFVYDDAAFCVLPRAASAEIVGEVADLLIRCRGVRRVFCGAVVGDDLFTSVRTAPDDGDAVALLRPLLENIGHGGGHAHRAGGKIAGACRGPKVGEELYDELRNRWLSVCAVDRQRGTRLVAKREIIDAL
jgi:nanoRNase/pAp phosphatase (c-di-AMP/oligoRNAs hydrolase)